MAFFDLPIEELERYRPERHEPDDFEEFWRATLDETRAFPLEPVFAPYPTEFRAVEVFDVTFRGFGGHPIKGWLLLPKQRRAPLPCVVEFLGYSCGRGLPHTFLAWPCAGYALLVMDTRGQGGVFWGGDTPDPGATTGPQAPGFMTEGVLDPHTYYYRRVYTDTARAVEAAQSHPEVDPERIAVTGMSQGGGLSIAAAALSPAVRVCMPEMPFLCHMRRGSRIVDNNPYQELARFCQAKPEMTERVFRTISYFDGMTMAARARAEALFSVGLMDDICPPSTVYAAYNYYAGKKSMRVYEYNGHNNTPGNHIVHKLRFLQSIWPTD